MGNINDDLLDFDIPTWAVTSLVNSDNSGLEDDDIEKLNKFTDEIVAKYGNANFMMGSDEEMESQFKYKNDIDGVLGADVVTMYLQPTKNYAKGTTIKGLPTKQQVFNYWNNQINKDPKKVGGYWDSTMLDINSTLMSENAIQHFGVYTEKGETEIEEDIYDWGSEFHYDWEQKNKKYAKGTTIEGGKLGKYIVNGTIKIKREEGGYDTERVNGSVMANNKDEAENKVVAYYENRYGTSESEMEVDLMVSNIFAKGTTIEEFNYNPKIDYLSEYHLLPKKVQDIIFKEEYEDSTYESNNKLIKELNGIGWTADYDLSASIYDLKPIDNYAKGTTIKFDKLPKNRQADKNYDYFAVGKIDGKIVDGWEIVDDVESLKYYAKIDLKDNDYNPKNFNIVSAKYLIRKGINPFDYNNWRKIDYSTNESAYATKFLEGEIYADGGGVESEINELYKKSKFINDDFNWKLKLMEMIQDRSIEAYNIYQSLTKEQKEEVLQEQFEVDNDMGSDGDGTIKTTKQNIRILLNDAKNGTKYEEFSLGGKIDNGYFNNCFLKSIFGV